MMRPTMPRLLALAIAAAFLLCASGKAQEASPGEGAVLVPSGAAPAAPTAPIPIDQEQHSEDAAQRAAACEALAHEVAVAMPVLLDCLTDESEEVRDAAARGFGAMGSVAIPTLVNLLESEDPEVALAAFNALGHSGEAVEEAVPAVVAFLRGLEYPERARAIESLGKIGEAALPLLDALLSNQKLGHDASNALWRMGSCAKPVLERGLKDASVEINARYACAQGLHSLGEPGLSILLDALDTEEPGQLSAAADALRYCTGVARQAIPKLLIACHNPDAGARRSALVTLTTISPGSYSVVQACILGMMDDSDQVRAAAQKSLIEVQPDIVPELVDVLKMTPRANRQAVEETLAAYDTKAVDAVAQLLLDSTETADRASAIRILGHIKNLPVSAREQLQECLKDERAEVRLAAVQAYDAQPPECRPPLESLTPLLADPAISVRGEVYKVMAKMRPVPDKLLPTIEEALKSRDVEVRLAAYEAVRELGPEARSLVPLLAAALGNSTRQDIQRGLAKAFEAIGPEAAGAAPVIIRRLYIAIPPKIRSKVCVTRSYHWKALMAVAPASPEAISYLARLVETREFPPGPNDGLSDAVKALGAAGRKAAKAEPALRKILGDDALDAQLRVAAAQALYATAGPDEELCAWLRAFLSSTPAHTQLGREAHDLLSRSLRELIVFEVSKEEIESDRPGWSAQHFQFYLAFERGPTKIPLARLYVKEEEGKKYPYKLGFDRGSLEVDWVKKGELLQATWTTCQQGQGINSVNSVLLLRRDDTAWKELFRHTGKGVYRWKWENWDGNDWRFVYDENLERLLFERKALGEATFDEPHALTVPREDNGKTYFYQRIDRTTRWPCEITEQGVILQPGLRWLDLGEETFPFEEIAPGEAARRYQRPTSDEEVAAVVEDLRRLNPAFAETGKCTGKVVVNDAVPPLVPCTETLYEVGK